MSFQFHIFTFHFLTFSKPVFSAFPSSFTHLIFVSFCFTHLVNDPFLLFIFNPAFLSLILPLTYLFFTFSIVITYPFIVFDAIFPPALFIIVLFDIFKAFTSVFACKVTVVVLVVFSFILIKVFSSFIIIFSVIFPFVFVLFISKVSSLLTVVAVFSFLPRVIVLFSHFIPLRASFFTQH